MWSLICQIHYATSANLSIPEIILILLLAVVAWHNRKDKQWFPVAYCVFLILYGKSGDVFLGISTSGNSKNVLYAATTAHAKGMKVIGLTGAKDSKLRDMSDVCIKAPQTETYMIQELHLPIYHCLCLMLENKFFSE